MEQLTGRTAVITGAGSGIGAALATRLGAAEMKLVLADIEEAALARTSVGLLEAGVEHTAQVVDVADAASVDALAEHAFSTYGAVDVLCNNAGVFAGGHAWTQSRSDYEWVFDVNVWGVIHGIAAFVPRMIEQGTAGHIINTSSVAGMFGMSNSAPYAASKFAVFGLTECLAKDLAAVGSRLRASVLCPGLVDTGIAQSSRNRQDAPPQTEDAATMDQVLADLTAGSMDPAEIAESVVAAIGDGRFLILSGPSFEEDYRTRTERLLIGALPPGFE